MLWRNGLGATIELARQDHDVQPATAAETQAGFIWRISRADVASDGPFSNFPGVDRILFLLSGNGFTLDLNGKIQKLTSRYQSARFPGDQPVDCRLIDGPCRDLNIMVSRAHASAAALIHDKPANAILAGPSILHAITGNWTVEIDGSKTPIAEDHLVIITKRSGTACMLEGAGALLQADIFPVA